MTDNILEQGLAKLAPGDTDINSAVKTLVRYIEEIELFNSAYGLVKVQNRRELVVRHILDSLAPLSILRRLHGRPLIADVGSGAGLPGIPLAVCMPEAEFTLIERMGRRAGFLRNTAAVLGLSNVKVEEAEMEKIAPAGCFDIVVFRAFRPLEPLIFKGLSRLLADGGVLAAYKGRRQSLDEEMAGLINAPKKGAFPSIGGWEALPLEVPFLEEERHLVLISAISGPSARQPDGSGHNRNQSRQSP
ncbi:MAG: 16S rRNA (guanine(527)-N(7))-methyltransferase RsmG [Treponema sp.]|nr:16S rRNA (guanine(527)-N(7))-methyltransferase RsmG [Treponema sp.]